jgi:signal transduction histidine kinase
MILLGGLFILRAIRRERDLARLRLRLLANVSHELKTPVTSIRMFAEMLSGNGTDPARARGFAGHILRESERLSRLIEDVLDTARPERAMDALHPEPVDIAALVRSIASPFAERAREAGIDVRLEGADSDAGDVTVETSAPAVERILSNLLDNALKYRRPRDARIVLALERAGSGVRIVVRDNGPGIAGKDRARVFDEFYRARYDDYAVKGAGLGLAIARRLARRLGGDIRVDSKEGQGSTFTLSLPAKAPSGAGARGA